MQEVLANQLKEKDVIGSEGAEVGALYNVTADVETGRLEQLIVTPTDRHDAFDFETDPQGRYLIPQSRVESVKDKLVVNLK